MGNDVRPCSRRPPPPNNVVSRTDRSAAAGDGVSGGVSNAAGSIAAPWLHSRPAAASRSRTSWSGLSDSDATAAMRCFCTTGCWRASAFSVSARPDLEQDAGGILEQRLQRGREPHRFAQVACPVVGRGRARRHRAAQRSRSTRSAALAHACRRRATASRNGATTGSIIAEWKACEVRSARQAMPSPSSCAWNAATAGDGPADDARASGEFSAASDTPVGQAREHGVRRQADRQHRTGRLRLHQRATTCHQVQRIGQFEHTRQRGGDELADAVADHGRRHDAAAHPQPRQCVLDDEGRRLHHRGRRAARRRRRRTGARAGRSPGRRATTSRTRRRASRNTGSRSYSPRPIPGYVAPWPGNMKTMPPPRAGRLRAASACMSGERSDAIALAVSSAATAMRCANAFRPTAQSPRNVGQVVLRMGLQMVGQAFHCRSQCRRRARRQHQQLRRRWPGSRPAVAALPPARRARWCRPVRTNSRRPGAVHRHASTDSSARSPRTASRRSRWSDWAIRNGCSRGCVPRAVQARS